MKSATEYSRIHRMKLKKLEAEKMREVISFVKNRDEYSCQVCGSKSGYMNAHHIIPKRQFPMFKKEADNMITLCARCHRFGRFSPHQNAIGFSEWLRNNRPEQWEIAFNRLKEFKE